MTGRCTTTATAPAGRLIALLRSADWLTADRATAWCRVLAAMTVVLALGWIGLSHGGIDRQGKPLGTDFVSFWTASRLALEGQPAAAYQSSAHLAEQRALFPSLAGQPVYFAFFYPPTFLLLLLPLALLPYPAALPCGSGADFPRCSSVFAACCRRAGPCFPSSPFRAC